MSVVSRRLASLCAIAVAVAACGGDPNSRDGGSDGGGGGRFETGMTDVERPAEAGADEGPDEGPDEALPDIVVEDTPFDSVDEGIDAAPDAFDAAPDAVDEEAAVDGGGEASVVEAGPETGACLDPMRQCMVRGALVCVDLQSDSENCGACGNACGSGLTCVAGRCSCGDGRVLCGGVCVNTQTDNTNCGACGTICSDGATCSDGMCACPMGQMRCGSACVNLQSSDANCGACGNACAGGSACVSGMCRCPMGETLCGGRCVNLQSDRANCGMCGSACAMGQLCNAGSCSLDCTAPRMICGSGTTAVCTDLQSDSTNCGTCGTACGAGRACTMGSCLCTGGRTSCGAGTAATCVDTQTDNANCGACGTACPSGSACTAGRCVCGGGQTLCGTGTAARCVNTSDDTNNCGACGTVCSGGANATVSLCSAGQCRPVCLSGYGNCNSVASDGCEANFASDSNNCGACGNVCRPRTSCQAGGRCIGPAAMIVIVSGNGQTATVGGAYANPLRVRVLDEYGTDVPGAPIAFTINTVSGGPGAMAMGAVPTSTDAMGYAQLAIVANNRTGMFTVTASSGSVGPVTFMLRNTPGAAATIVPVSPTTSMTGRVATQVRTAFANPFVAEVRDSFGNVVPGTMVTWAGGGSTTPGAALAPAGVHTADAMGRVTVNGTGNAIAGDYTITATAAGVVTPASFYVKNTPGPAARIVVESGSAQSTRVTTMYGADLVARVTDADDNLVGGGVSVTFVVPTATGSASVSLPTGSNPQTTAADSRVRVRPTANTKSGMVTVNAYLTANMSVATTGGWVLTNTAGPPNSIVAEPPLEPTPRDVVVGTTISPVLAATVYDQYMNPVPSVMITFKLRNPAQPGSASWAYTVDQIVGTGTDGRGTLAMMANTVAGTYSVRVGTPSLGFSESNVFAIRNVPGPATAMRLHPSESPQFRAALIGHDFALPFGVQVIDQYMNPIPTRTVSWTVVPGGTGASAVPSAASVETDSDGVASITARANSTVGTYSLRASTMGTSSMISLTFTMANVPIAPNAIQLLSGEYQHTPVNTDFMSPLVARAVYDDGEGGITVIPNVVVRFDAGYCESGSPCFRFPMDTQINDRVSDASGQVTSAILHANCIPNVEGGIDVYLPDFPSVYYYASLASDPGMPARVEVLSGDGATANPTFGTPLCVHTFDSCNNELDDRVIEWTAPSTPPTLQYSGSTMFQTVTGYDEGRGAFTSCVYPTAMGNGGPYSVSVRGIPAPSTGLPPTPAVTISGLRNILP